MTPNVARMILAPGPKHPARFSAVLLPIFDRLLVGHEPVLDPFAGTGRIHDLSLRTVGVEIEPEWAAMRPATVVGDALGLPFGSETFGSICTSPTYGNRFADHHEAHDGSVRRSYRHDLGRPLHPSNSGRLQWGGAYREFHRRAWAEALRVLRPGGRFILNVKDHIRAGEVQPVAAWHLDMLQALGLVLIDEIHVPAPGLRYGENRHRIDHEVVFAFELAEDCRG